MRIAIMQPYFVPYPGYFRLFAEADLFVLFDCVQFPRRGYVHRNQFPDANENRQWLTLPLAPAARDIRICDLTFAADAPERLARQCRRFPSLADLPAEWRALFGAATGPLVPWLETSLALCNEALGLKTPLLRSSTLNLSAEHIGQDRIIKICQTLGATSYLNPPGGRHIYAQEVFNTAGLELLFLPPYAGSTWSVLHELQSGGRSQLVEEMRQTRLST